MANDFSRVRLNPLLDFAGVELKQGAVMLDADANELTAILDRRLRALASDVLGRATVSSTTPDAFEIAVSGTALSIGKGRLYVDGLLAENHGAASNDAADRIFVPLMAEPQFADPILYPAQPYLPNPPALPTAGRHLVYLDVWNREVTHLVRPDLVENAIGVETTSRLQTVWQVRVTPEDVGTATTCATPDDEVPGWDDIVAPSAGVLSTGTFEVAPVDDPCDLPPTGGYRGLENQLYRVEIHDGGAAGTATFKWSRENASVGSRVASLVSATEIEVESLGRDDVLSIKDGDWVEIIDDPREFAQLAGEMRKVTINNPETRRLVFAPALPAAMLPGSFPNSEFPDARNLRVRRWDQARRIFRTGPNGTTVQMQDLDAANSPGVITVPGANTTLLLENGITVRFASTGDRGFKPGNYWVFAARTADASVEILDRAPPRGIHHHYARLGIWDVAAGTVTNCRNNWPPEVGEGHDCGCTACVTEASHADGSFTIQDAVNQAAQTGGTVCIGPGQFPLREAVRMTGFRSVLVKGQGPATSIATTAGAFLIQNSTAVGVESLAILSVGNRPAIAVQSAAGLSLRKLVIAVLDVTGDSGSSAIALEGALLDAMIGDNIVFAETGVLANDPTAPRDESAPEPFLLAAALSVRDNVLLCSRRSVALDGRVLHIFGTEIRDNHAFASADAAISTLGVALAGSSVNVTGNCVFAAGTGIRSSCDGLWVADNKLHNTAANDEAVGVLVARGLVRTGTTMAQILANQIDGYGQAGIQVSSPVRDLIVKLNIIAECGNGILAVGHPDGAVSIENNHLRDIDARREAGPVMVGGIAVTHTISANVAGNTMRAIGVNSPTAAFRAGVFAIGVQRARLRDNETIGVGPTGDALGRTAGIAISAPMREFEAQQNRIERDADVIDQEGVGEWTALLVQDVGEVLAGAGSFTTVNLRNGRAVVVGPAGEAFVADLGSDDRGQGASGSVLGNTFISRGHQLAVDITASHCLFGDNRVQARFNQKEAVALITNIAAVTSNQVEGGEVSIRLDSRVVTVVGNLTTGEITNVPEPFVPLNVRF